MGRKMMAYKLTTDKGVDQTLVSNMIADLVSDQAETEKCIDMASKYIKKKRIWDKKDLQKVGAYLFTKGFEWNIINQALDQIELWPKPEDAQE
jgi:SOS response regulatory protein OraA/RecX